MKDVISRLIELIEAGEAARRDLAEFGPSLVRTHAEKVGSLRKLARLTDVSPAYLSSVKAARCPISLKVAKRIVSMDDVYPDSM